MLCNSAKLPKSVVVISLCHGEAIARYLVGAARTIAMLWGRKMTCISPSTIRPAGDDLQRWPNRVRAQRTEPIVNTSKMLVAMRGRQIHDVLHRDMATGLPIN